MNITITMLTAIFVILREISKIASGRKELMEGAFSIYVAGSAKPVFSKEAATLSKKYGLTLDKDSFNYDNVLCGSLRQSLLDAGIDIHDAPGVFSLTVREAAEFEEDDVRILRKNNLSYRSLYSMTTDQFEELGFSPSFIQGVSVIRSSVGDLQAGLSKKDKAREEFRKNCEKLLAETSVQIKFLNDLVTTFVAASLAGDLSTVTRSEPMGIKEAILVILESLSIDPRIARGYEYGDIRVLASDVYTHGGKEV